MSGKTEWATLWANESIDRVRLSWTDILRSMGGKYSRVRRPLAFETAIHLMTEALRRGVSVVLDEENLQEPEYALFQKHAEQMDAFVVWHTMDATADECKQLNAALGHPIQDIEIDRKAERYEEFLNINKAEQ